MPALEQVTAVIKALQLSMVVLLTKIVDNVSLKTITILAKRLILVFRWVQDVPLQIDTLQPLKCKQRYVKMEDK